jgi:hypothetical protein
VLFSHEEVASFIQTRFEPAWEMVRPVPLVRIDFGNGAHVTRTLHGNIATYVCTADGKVLDILPGMYDPATYLDRLKQLRLLAQFAAQCWGKEARVQEYHQVSAAALRHYRVPLELSYPQGFTGGVGGNGFQGRAPGEDFRVKKGFGGDWGGGGFGPQGDCYFLGGAGFKGGIERPLKIMLAGGSFSGAGQPTAPRQPAAGGWVGRPGQRARVTGPTKTPRVLSPEDRAVWQRLRKDAGLNETVRRQKIHELLADTGLVKPQALTRRIYQQVLHSDLDDPYLGLGDVLFGNYPFTDQEHDY